MNKIELIKDELTGVYSVSNYPEVKQTLEHALAEYQGKTYSSPEEAAKDREVLENYKSDIQDVLDQIRKPYSEAEKQLNSLLKLIQEPLSVINKYEKTLREEERRKELISIAEECGAVLGEYKYFIIIYDANIQSSPHIS